MKKPIGILAFLVLLMAAAAASYGQSFSIISPNGGETWALDSTQVISWNSQNVPAGTRVKILLFLNGSPAGTIAGDLPASQGTFSWKTGALGRGGTAAEAGGYKVRVKAVGQPWLDQTNGTFTIGPRAAVVRAPIHKDVQILKLPPLLKPKLAVTAIRLAPNASGYGIIFGYKNVGPGSLPPRHEMPVKPDYRVLIDGREIAAGDLWVPETPPAGPGYEQPTNSGGFIEFPQPNAPRWSIGSQITIILNERNVLDMGPATKTSSLRLIALPVGYDLAFAAVTFDWTRCAFTAMVTRVGSMVPLSKTFSLTAGFAGYHPKDDIHAGPGEATVTTAEGPFTGTISPVTIPASGPFPYRAVAALGGPYSTFYEINIWVNTDKRDELDETNDSFRIRFDRPSSTIGPVIDALTVREGTRPSGDRYLVPTIRLLNRTPNPFVNMRVVLKRNSSTAQEWSVPYLAGGAEKTIERTEDAPGGNGWKTIYYDAYLYGGGGALLDAKRLKYDFYR